MQAAAEREKRKAVVTRSEGAKRSAILSAEARLESAKRDANARSCSPEASARSHPAHHQPPSATNQPDVLPCSAKIHHPALERMGGKDNGLKSSSPPPTSRKPSKELVWAQG